MCLKEKVHLRSMYVICSIASALAWKATCLRVKSIGRCVGREERSIYRSPIASVVRTFRKTKDVKITICRWMMAGWNSKPDSFHVENKPNLQKFGLFFVSLIDNLTNSTL